MDLKDAPHQYWHCLVQISGEKDAAIINDLTFTDLDRSIVQPWLSGRPFTVDGQIVRSTANVARIQIAYTPKPKQAYADEHDARMRANNVADWATDRRKLPFKSGQDYTYELLFAGASEPAPDADVSMVERLCRRLPQAAKILGERSRKVKKSLQISDEYDVQDLLHALLRAYLKYSVQEDPLPKVAGTSSGRADISIEDLGVLIEVKYVYGPSDQKRIFDDLSQDLLLYTQWAPLRVLIYLIYNSADLRDPESLEKLAGPQEVNGRRFNLNIILA